MNWKSLRIVGCLTAALVGGHALAAEEADLVEKVAVRNRLFTVNGRYEVGFNAGLTLLARLTDHYNFNVAVAYNLNEWFALEVRGGYAYAKHTSLADQIEGDFFKNTLKQKSILDDMTDLWEMNGNAALGVRFQPIYGKLNLMAELPVHFQLYLWAGVGAGQFTRSSLVLCANKPDTTNCRAIDPANDKYDVVKENKFGPLASAAVGFRFFLTPNHSVKVEVRDWAYLDSYYVGVKRDQQSAALPTAGGQLNPNAGITHLAQVDLGYAYIF